MGQKIAIVDDNRSLLESLRLALGGEGFEVDSYDIGEVDVEDLLKYNNNWSKIKKLLILFCQVCHAIIWIARSKQ